MGNTTWPKVSLYNMAYLPVIQIYFISSYKIYNFMNYECFFYELVEETTDILKHSKL